MRRVAPLVSAILFLIIILSVQAEESTGEIFNFLPIITNPPLDTSDAPPHSTSFYITDMEEIAMRDLGCELATRTAFFEGFSTVSLLHFGQPWEENGMFGVRYFAFNNPFASTSDVIDAVRAFALQYNLCSIIHNSPVIILGVGVSNFGGGQVSEAHGEAWGQLINDIVTALKGTPAENKVIVVGAGDLEPGFNSPTNTLSWVDGFFNGIQNNVLYNFGTAGGCPETEPPPGAINCGTEEYPEWTLEDMRSITARNANIEVVPEIYQTNGRNAWQWHYVAVHAYETGVFPVIFTGSLTQLGACEQRPTDDGCTANNPYLKNSPDAGWAQLFFELAGDPRVAQEIPYASDLRWQGE